MKILFAIKALDGASGGAERVLADVSNGLAARGHDVSILSYDAPGGESHYPLATAVRRIPLGLGRTHRRATLVETLRRLPALRRVVRRECPDVVVGFMHSMYIPLGLALLGSAVPQVASEHIVFTHYDSRPLERFLLHLAPLLVGRITVLSEAVRQTYPRSLQRRMTVMPNPVAARPSAQADVIGAERSRRIVLTVGRLTPQKDHRTLIEAFAGICDEFPDWDVRIVGEGELQSDLQRQIAALGLENRVTLAGTTSEIESEYRRAQLFAIPSLYESFGLSTAEAMAHGLPVVGFADCPGTNELVVDGKNGLLVSGNDRARALADGLRRLLMSTEDRASLGRNGPPMVRRFSPERVCDLWESLLEQTVAGEVLGGESRS